MEDQASLMTTTLDQLNQKFKELSLEQELISKKIAMIKSYQKNNERIRYLGLINAKLHADVVGRVHKYSDEEWKTLRKFCLKCDRFLTHSKYPSGARVKVCTNCKDEHWYENDEEDIN